MTPEQVAGLLGLKVKTLYNWRHAGLGPRALKVGKYLRYEPSAVDAYVESLRTNSEQTTRSDATR